MTESDGTAATELPGTVTGSVTYRERIALRPGTVVEVRLLDTSRADVPAREIARQVIEDPASPPIPFVLEYDPSQIDERMEYGVRAAIKRDDRLLFTTDTHYPVLTRGAGDTADLLLVMVDPPAGMPDALLTNTYWKLTTIGTEPYRHQSAEREPHIRFNGEDATVSGRTGCNTFSGGYEMAGNDLKLGNLAVTQRACIEGMETERIYLDALGATDRFEITGDTLTLFAADKALLGFQAIYL
jgi:putative lipoprotein